MADPIVRVRIVAEDRAAATIKRVQESSRGLQTELRRLAVSPVTLTGGPPAPARAGSGRQPGSARVDPP